MKLQYLSLPLLFTFIPFLLMVIKIVKRSKENNILTSKLPPGPWKLPFIGNLHQLVGSLPYHQCLRDLAKKYGPLMYLQLGEVSYIVISSPDTAKEIMKTHDIIFSHRPNFLAPRIISYDSTNILFAQYGGYWRQVRKFCTMEFLSTKRVQSFRSIREEEVSNFVKIISLNEKLPINLTEKIFDLTYSITSRAAFGKKCKDQKAFKSIVNELITLAAGFSLADVYPSIEAITGLKSKLEMLRRQTDGMLQEIINEHKERKALTKPHRIEEKEDLVHVLLKLQDSNPEFPLSDDNIKAVILDMFTAGSETSSITVDWVMSEMLKNPEVMKKAQAEVRQVFEGKGKVNETGIHELKFLKSVIKKTLRLHPPVPLIPRQCSENCTINGCEIPTKTRVIVNTWAIGRDPDYWSEAEKFYPERFLSSSIDFKGMDFEFIPFGGGRRICPGISFAVPNIELPLAQLLYHFDWELPGGMNHEDLNMTEASGATVRRKKDMIVIPICFSSYSAC